MIATCRNSITPDCRQVLNVRVEDVDLYCMEEVDAMADMLGPRAGSQLVSQSSVIHPFAMIGHFTARYEEEPKANQ